MFGEAENIGHRRLVLIQRCSHILKNDGRCQRDRPDEPVVVDLYSLRGKPLEGGDQVFLSGSSTSGIAGPSLAELVGLRWFAVSDRIITAGRWCLLLHVVLPFVATQR